MKILLSSIIILIVVWIIACPFREVVIPELEEVMEHESITYEDIVEVLETESKEQKGITHTNRKANRADERTVLTSKVLAKSLSVSESAHEEVSYDNPPILVEVEPSVSEALPVAPTETAPETTVAIETEREVTTAAEASAAQETSAQEYNGTPLYGIVEPTGVNVLDESIQVFMYTELSKYGLEWFMPYAIMIAYQESRFNPRAENPNGIDKGLLQYRIKYYPGSDIFNPYEQITIFCQQMSNRANIGCSVYEMISRHNTSDYGTYNQAYVNEVMQHEGNLIRINGF